MQNIVIHAEYSRHDNDYAMLKIREVPSSVKPIQLAPANPIGLWYFGPIQAKNLSWDGTVNKIKCAS